MFKFSLVTPEGITYEDETEKVTVPTKDGEITVLENHIPMVSVLKPGEIIVHKSDHPVSLAVSSGVVEVRPTSHVVVLAETAERAEHIDVEKAEEARLRAKDLLEKQENIADVDFARMQAKIEKEMARVNVGKKYNELKNLAK